MVYHKINERAVTEEDFKKFLLEMNVIFREKGVENPTFIMDNARIHHYKGLYIYIYIYIYIYMLKGLEKVSRIKKLYLPPYSPFLNPIENIFSVRKNLVMRRSHDRKQRCLIVINLMK